MWVHTAVSLDCWGGGGGGSTLPKAFKLPGSTADGGSCSSISLSGTLRISDTHNRCTITNTSHVMDWHEHTYIILDWHNNSHVAMIWHEERTQAHLNNFVWIYFARRLLMAGIQLIKLLGWLCDNLLHPCIRNDIQKQQQTSTTTANIA